MRRISNLFNKNKISESEFSNLENSTSNLQSQINSHQTTLNNCVQFPFEDLILAPWGANILVRFADADRGNDNNDGKTLASAKKSIQSALDSLPSDLHGYEVRIFVHPGTYLGTSGIPAITCSLKNGTIRFSWLGMYANVGDPAYVNTPNSAFLTNLLGGRTVLSNNQIIVKGVSCSTGDGSVFFTSWDQNYTLTVSFNSGNFGKNWDEASAQYAYRWKFMQDETLYSTTIWSIISAYKLKAFYFDNPVEIDFTYALRFGLTLDCLSGRVDGIKFTSRVLSNINTDTQYYSGLVFLGAECTESLLITNVYYPSNGYHPDFPRAASGVGWVVEGVRQFLNFTDGCKAVCDIGANMIYNQGVLPDSVIPTSYLRAGAKASLTYHSDKFTLSDLSIQPHYINDNKTNFVKQFISAEIAKFGNNLVQQIHTSAIADADLRNKDISFYLDEINNKLKFKIKYANGTVKNGEIALT